MQDNSVPLSCANINYPSALLDMLPSTPIQRPWRESATYAQGGVTVVDSSVELYPIYHHLPRLDLGEKHEGKRVLECINVIMNLM